MKSPHRAQRAQQLLGLSVAAVLAFSLVPLARYSMTPAQTAYATNETSQPKTAYELQQEIEEAQEAFTQAKKESEEAAKEVAEHEERIKDIEENQLPEQQKRTSNATRQMYKVQQNSVGIIDVLLHSGSLGEFINQLEYITRVTDKHMAEVRHLAELKEELESARVEFRAAQEEADQRADEAYAILKEAQEAQAEVQRRIEEDARREASLAANGGQLVSGDRDNTSTPASNAAQNTQNAAANEANGSGGSNGNGASNGAGSGGSGGSGSEGSNGSGDSGGSNGTSAPEAPSAPEQTLYTPPPASDSLEGWAARIDAYLAGSPMAGQGYTFASAALTYGVDPRFSPAIACIESGKGSICFLPHNAWGWGSVSWGSWEEAINSHVRGLASLYGYTVTLEGAKMYCPPNYQNWYNMVSSQMALI